MDLDIDRLAGRVTCIDNYTKTELVKRSDNIKELLDKCDIDETASTEEFECLFSHVENSKFFEWLHSLFFCSI